MTNSLARRAGHFASAVLSADAAIHLYWLTGATWPAPDSRALSLAVLGFTAPFTPRVLVPLALSLAIASAAVWWRLHRGANGLLGKAAQIITVAVAAAAALQLPFRTVWVLDSGGRSAVFYWLNLAVYLPLCTLLALAAFRVARPWRRAHYPATAGQQISSHVKSFPL